MKLLKISYIRYLFYALASLIACVFIIMVSKTILAPLAISTLLSVALYPIVVWIQKIIPSKLWSIIILLFLVTLCIGGLFFIIIFQLNGLYEDFPNITEKFSRLVQNVEMSIKNTFNLPKLNLIKITKENSDEIIKSGSTNGISSIFGGISGFLNYVVIVPIYIFLLLYYQSSITDFVKKVLIRFKIKASPVLRKISILIQSYLKGMLIVMLLLGITNSIGLFLLGVPYAFVLGFMVAIFGIIPYIGTLLGGVIVLFVSYFSQESSLVLLYIIILFSIVQFVEGNFLTPKIIGEKVNLNPLVAILALLIGGQIWGIIGMIMALPIASILIMISKNIKDSAFYTTDKSVTQGEIKS